MIDADADVLTAHSDSQSKLQMPELMWRPSLHSFIFKQHGQERITFRGLIHPHHLFLLI